MVTTPFLGPALHYASLGWAVFPLAPGEKRPITAHGVKDATTDEAQIREWWSKWPSANIAVACGEISSVYVVDVDTDSGRGIDGHESLKEFPSLPETVRQDTPRGGFHAFFQASNPPANRNSFRPGIDIRGNGYYVVVAPSIHPNGGQYKWSPGCAPWQRTPADYPDFLRPATRAPWSQETQVRVPMRTSVLPDTAVVERARGYLAACDAAVQGQAGHDKLLWAAQCLVGGFALSDTVAFELLASEYNPRCVPPWDLTNQRDYKDFMRKITEARKNPPRGKPHGWLLEDAGYSTPVILPSPGDIAALIAEAQREHADKKSALYREELAFLCSPTGLLGRICSWINATAIKPQPLLALGCSLAALGALFGRKIRDELGNYTNLYCVGIAPSSAGKAHAMNQIRRLFTEAGAAELLGGDTVTSDAAIEERLAAQPATLFLWDEIGHLLSFMRSGGSSHHVQVVSMLMKLYSAAGSVYLGREYALSDKQRTIIQPCLCLYGASTPERFTEGLTPQNLQDGWISRVLTFYSHDMPSKARGLKLGGIPDDLIQDVQAWATRQVPLDFSGGDVKTLATPSHTPAIGQQIVIPTQVEAEREFVAFDAYAEHQARHNSDSGSIWLKAEENARRVALIVAAGQAFEQPVISQQDAQYACRLMKFLLADFVMTVEPEITASITEAAKRKLVAIVRQFGKAGCVKRDITRKSQFLNQRLRDQMVADLLEAGELICIPSGHTAKFWIPQYAPQNHAIGNTGDCPSATPKGAFAQQYDRIAGRSLQESSSRQEVPTVSQGSNPSRAD